ncbi:MAG: prepilin peptidase [Candidatus Pacebacteria bacterium]|nr:prepilin peptidase [Candidatus Paceibacterota bacterium]
MSIFVFLVGLCVGSFLNVVASRWDSKDFWKGRSFCDHTGKKLPWYDNIPVLSYVMLLGKSRYSGKRISLQYPLVEILTGVVFFAVYMKFSDILPMVVSFAIVSILIVIFIYDLHTKIIPDQLSYSFAILSLILLLINGNIWIWDILAGPILFSPFAFLWIVSKGTWMGFGDAKLAWGIGWMLGLFGGINAIVISFWIGAIVGILLIALKKVVTFLPNSFSIKSEVPFAPFLVTATFLVFFFSINILIY